MFSVSRDDVLRGLKRFRRLAKQDLLASPSTSDPDFWSEQATARRAVYGELMHWVEREGVEAAYRRALDGYTALPLLRAGESPALSGREQAFELFFSILGLDPREVTRLRNSRRRIPPQVEREKAVAKAGV